MSNEILLLVILVVSSLLSLGVGLIAHGFGANFEIVWGFAILVWVGAAFGMVTTSEWDSDDR